MNPTDVLNDRFEESSLFSERIVRKIGRTEMEWLFFLADFEALEEKGEVLEYLTSDFETVYELTPASVKAQIEERNQRSRR